MDKNIDVDKLKKLKEKKLKALNDNKMVTK